MKLLRLLSAGAAAIAFTASANAATITYTFGGNFGGTINGDAFASAGTFTATGDTDDAFAVGSGMRVPLSAVSAVLDGTTYNFTTQTQFFLNAADYVGLFPGCCGTGGGSFSGTGPGLDSYDGVSNFATTALTDTFVGPVTIFSDGGTITLSSWTDGTFGAVVAGPVPEPATWALLILGFGVVGGAMRRRSVSVSCA